MRRIAFGTVIGLGPVTGLVAAAVMALTTIVPTPLLAGLSFFLLGVGPILWVISTTTLRNRDAAVAAGRYLRHQQHGVFVRARPLASRSAPCGRIYGAEACLYLATAIFRQALVILASGGLAGAAAGMVGEPARC
jgi:hypothetical protein